MVKCAYCKTVVCVAGSKKGPEGCPMLENSEAINKAVQIYDNPDEKELARNAGITEATGYAE